MCVFFKCCSTDQSASESDLTSTSTTTAKGIAATLRDVHEIEDPIDIAATESSDVGKAAKQNRIKKSYSTIVCVEIKPDHPHKKPYMMCQDRMEPKPYSVMRNSFRAPYMDDNFISSTPYAQQQEVFNSPEPIYLPYAKKSKADIIANAISNYQAMEPFSYYSEKVMPNPANAAGSYRKAAYFGGTSSKISNLSANIPQKHAEEYQRSYNSHHNIPNSYIQHAPAPYDHPQSAQPPCGTNLMISCQPQVTPVACGGAQPYHHQPQHHEEYPKQAAHPYYTEYRTREQNQLLGLAAPQNVGTPPPQLMLQSHHHHPAHHHRQHPLHQQQQQPQPQSYYDDRSDTLTEQRKIYEEKNGEMQPSDATKKHYSKLHSFTAATTKITSSENKGGLNNRRIQLPTLENNDESNAAGNSKGW